VSATAEISSDCVGDGRVTPQLTRCFTVRVGLYCTRHLDAFDETHFIEHQHAWVVLIAVFLDIFPRDMDKSQFAI
jgi:hypothetical protein